jgi:hypothetical protein
MRQHTHYINDANQSACAQVFTAWQCESCHALHRTTGTEVELYPWITAAIKFKQVETIPDEGCPKLVNRAESAYTRETQ